MVERARKWVDLIKRSDDDDDKIMNVFENTRLLNGFTTRANDKRDKLHLILLTQREIPDTQRALILQGGGALVAHDVGVF